MSTWWILSYVVLWIIVAVLAVLVLAVLREFGLLRHGTGGDSASSVPHPQDDGPEIGSVLPSLAVAPCNGFDALRLGTRKGIGHLVVFMSPLCEGCQESTDVLNTIADEHGMELRIVAIMRGPEGAIKAYLKVYPLRFPLIFDEGEQIHGIFNVHNAPFALLYDEEGRLVRRGVTVNGDDLAGLFGHLPASGASRARVFPGPEVDVRSPI